MSLNVGAPVDLGAAMYEVVVGDLAPGALRVALFKGREEVNGLFRFDVHFRFVGASDHADDEDLEYALMHMPARLVLHWETGSRTIEGVVGAIEVSGVHMQGGITGRLRILPRMFRLGLNKDSRIFQDMTVVDIVSSVLGEHGVPFTWALSQAYPKRAYCTQYQESDYELVTRLLAEEGIFFFFRHPDSPTGAPLPDAFSDGRSEVVVLADDPSAYPDILGSTLLTCKSMSMGGPENEGTLSTFAFRRKAGPETAMVHDYDYRRPLVDLTWTSYPSAPSEDPVVRRGRVYEHHGEYENPDTTRNNAPTILQQHSRKLARAWGTSPCRRLCPGHAFALDHAEMHHLSDRYVVASVESEGYSPWTSHDGIPDYIAIYSAHSAYAPLRPPRPARAPRQVFESAIVVGAGAEEVHTDELGRVKVQLHWDRKGKRDEKSSCFLRVAQPWAGAGFGFQFVPRVGTEVLVGFLGGDLDNPVVVGGLHNVIQPPPIPFPASRTMSCIRSRSTPGGMGYNEIVFEDSAGQEGLWVRAQRDLREIVGGARSVDVAGDDALHVGKTRSVTIDGDERVGIGGDQVVRVQGHQYTTVRGNRFDTVYGAVEQTYEKDVTTAVFGTERRNVGGDVETRVEGSQSTFVRGDVTTIAGGDRHSSLLSHAEGLATLFGGDGAVVESPAEVLVRCGQSSVRLTPDRIELVAPEVVLRAPGASVTLREKQIDARAKDQASLRAEKVLVRSSGARLLLGKEANLDGAKVKIGCDPGPDDDVFPDDPCETTKIELRDDKGRPIPRQRYIVEFADGTSTGGLLGEDGKDEILLQRDGRILFPDVGPARSG